MRKATTWDKRYYSLAKLVSSWSKDPRKKVGAVVTDEDHVRGVGFNGFPKGIADTPERLNNKQLKNKLMIHAEVNAIWAANGIGDTIYIYPCLPCPACLGKIIQSHIHTIVTGQPDETSAWDQKLVIELIEEKGLTVVFMED